MRPENDRRMTIPAVRILEGKGLSLKDGAGPTAYRPPLYILWLVFNYVVFGKNALFGPSLLQAFASTANILLLYFLAKQIWENASIANLSALLLAIHPYSVYHDPQLYHTFLSTGLLLSGFWMLFRGMEIKQWKYLVLSGSLFGLCILVISTFVPFLAFLILAGLFLWRIAWRKRIELVSAFILGLCLTWSPWIIRNAIAFHHFIPLTTDSGVTLWMGNNPVSRELLKIREHEASPVPKGTAFNIPEFYEGCKTPNWCTSGISEYDESKELTAMAINWIKNHPADFFSLTLWRLEGIWSPFLTPPKIISSSAILSHFIRYGYAVWNLGLAVLFLIGTREAWRAQKKFELAITGAIVLIGTSAYALFLYYTKYRIPFEALLLPFCGAGLYSLWQIIRKHSKIKPS